jgi:CubicO group peptidase (beta-lactamase class C family)
MNTLTRQDPQVKRVRSSATPGLTRASTALLLAISASLGTGFAVGDELDSYIESQVREQRLPGLSLAVVEGGKVVVAKGYGTANLEVTTPAIPESVYELGSMTKQFTAMAVLMLAHEKRLSLDDPIARHIPEAPRAWREVTLRHLLNHTSGIPSHTEMSLIQADEGKEYTRQELLNLIAGSAMKFRPGEGWAYNDSGYVLLAWIVEKAAGVSYESFLAERIFKPLDMKSTRCYSRDEIVSHRASGYVHRLGKLNRGRPVSPTQSLGAGNLMSTVPDLARWDAALQGERLLPRRLLEPMWTPARLNNGKAVPSYYGDRENSSYGFGWVIGEYLGHPYVEHGGSISSGFTTDLLRFPADRLAVIVLTNRAVPSSGDNPDIPGEPRNWVVARGVAKRFLTRGPRSTPSARWQGARRAGQTGSRVDLSCSWQVLPLPALFGAGPAGARAPDRFSLASKSLYLPTNGGSGCKRFIH